MNCLKINLLIVFLFSAVSLHAEIYAVIVGVSKYKDPSDNLIFAASDAKRFHSLLTNNKQNPNIMLLVDEQATRSNILNVMNNIFKKANVADCIIFFFSGHGGDGYFCQYDTGDTYDSLLKHEDIQNAFKQSDAGVKLCIGDACFAGSIRNEPPSTTKSRVDFFKSRLNKSVAKKNNIIVFMSSRGDQYSKENIFLKQSVFAYYLIESFLGKADVNHDKKVTAKEMYTYVRKNVAEKTNNKQIPVMFGRFSENTVIASYK